MPLSRRTYSEMHMAAMVMLITSGSSESRLANAVRSSQEFNPEPLCPPSPNTKGNLKSHLDFQVKRRVTLQSEKNGFENLWLTVIHESARFKLLPNWDRNPDFPVMIGRHAIMIGRHSLLNLEFQVNRPRGDVITAVMTSPRH